MASTKVSTVSYPVRLQLTGHDFFTGNYVSPTLTRVVSATRTRTGERNPSWKKQVDAGENATTPLTARYDRINSGNGETHCRIDNPPQSIYRTEDLIGDIAMLNSKWNRTALDPLMSTTKADNRARAAFLKKIREQRTLFQGLVVLGEMRETHRMLRTRARPIFQDCKDIVNDLRKFRNELKNPRKLAKRAGELWLEKTFGWQPLLNDIQDAAKAWDRLVRDRTPRIPLTGSATDSDDTTHSRLDNVFVGVNQSWRPAQCIYTRVHSFDHLVESVIVRYKGNYTPQVEATPWDNWRLFGFAPGEFVPAAWELLPWSFLVDYFTNIGDILEGAVTVTEGVTWVNKTVLRRTHLWGSFALDLPATKAATSGTEVVTYLYGNPGYHYYIQRKDLTRSKDVGIQYPSLNFESGLSQGQKFNILALLTTARSLHPQEVIHRNWHR
jgi:hypothetical protein